MSEILSLAEKFKTQSKQQVTSIEQELQSATTQLNSFMTAKLQESETTIRQGIVSLDESNEQLQQKLDKHQQDTATALTIYTERVQALIAQDLNQLAKENQTMIQNYAQRTTQLIEQRESAIAQTLKSEIKTWVWWASGIVLLVLVIGMVLGAFIVNRFSKPIYIQQPISYVQPNYAQR